MTLKIRTIGSPDRFRRVRRSERGGFGKTIIVYDTWLQVNCLLKFIDADKLQRELECEYDEVQKILFQEARRLLWIKHPKVPSFYGVYATIEQSGRPVYFLLQEYIDGEDLRKELRRKGKLSLHDVLDVLEEGLHILSYLHSMENPEDGKPFPILHLDIKPENLIRHKVTQDIHLVDFGLALRVGSSMSKRSWTLFSMERMGSPGYAPPEQRMGEPTYASDLYSLGITCVELWSGLSSTLLAKKLKGGRLFDCISPLPPSLQRLLEGMLQLDEEKRSKDANKVLEELKKVRLSASIPTSLGSPSSSGSRLSTSFLQPFFGRWSMAFFLLLVVGATIGFIHRQDESQPSPTIQKYQGKRIEPSPGKRSKVRGFYDAYVRWIPPGTFRMGSAPGNRKMLRSEGPQHKVTLRQGFWMWETEVTQEQYRNLLQKNPSKFKNCGKSCPVEQVSWFEAVEFANRLSGLHGLERCYRKSGNIWVAHSNVLYTQCKGWRLPTEAEWEFAARAGTSTPYYTGRCISTQQANFDGTSHSIHYCPKGHSRRQTIPVRRFQPNAWGLYDMHGNVWEWVFDRFGPYPFQHVLDPAGPISGDKRLFRGGSWYSSLEDLRSTFRDRLHAKSKADYLGFRVVRSIPRERGKQSRNTSQ